MNQMSTPDILVVIPAFNEEGRIGKVVAAVRAVLPPATVLVVNDCSGDGTAAEARAAGARVISHPINLGYGSALELGYLYAIRRGCDVVVQMDGDGQHLAEEIPKILTPVLAGEADVAFGSRYLGGSSYRVPLVRRIGHRLLAAIFSAITHRKLADPTSGFQCLNRRAVAFLAKGDFPWDFPDVDVFLMIYFAGLTAREVPVRMVSRSGGRSMHSGLKPLYYMIKMLLSITIVVLNHRKWRQYGT